MDNIEKTPLGWEINLLYMFAHCSSILASDIDLQLQIQSCKRDRFDPQKKKALINFEKAIKEADDWMFKFGLDKITYEAVQGHNKAYSNVIANSNTLIRMAMLCLDRAHLDDGDARVFKALRALPSGGIFPEKIQERFRMKLELVPEKGDRVHTTNHGDGTLEDHLGQGNWQVLLDNGERIILNENKHFKIF